MCAMCSNHQQLFQLKTLRKLMYCSTVITVLSLILLFFNYRVDWIKFYKATSEPQIFVQPAVPQQCGQGQIVPQGQKVAVNKTKTLLMSAYQEHRTGRKEVRVIAVVLRSETVAYRCLLCCHDQLYISEGCETPSYITVTSAAADSEDKPDKEFLKVNNQKAISDSFPYNFTVCLSTMFDFTNVLQLVQGLEMLQLLGVNRVVIYKTSNSPEIKHVLDYYTQKGLVEVIPWSMSRFLNVSRGWLPEHGPGDLHYFGQIPALNDFIYRYMYQSRYVALQDIDELILPQSVNSWSELLPLLEKKYGADKCYMFENNVFPNTITLPPPTSETLPPQSRCCPGWQNVSGVNILAHLYQEPIIKETHYSNFKIIVNPRAVFIPKVHGLLDSLHGCSWVDRNIARMYHTRAPKQPNLTPDQLIYDGRLLSYSAQLTLTVNTVLMESGLLPEDCVCVLEQEAKL
uniref:Glycosyltransferase family 92 protein n=1 Tax=Dicentrarchus labrax TaxID=13489 RepID=A0A8C4EPR9_DICLA